jgi:hypothetical protein
MRLGSTTTLQIKTWPGSPRHLTTKLNLMARGTRRDKQGNIISHTFGLGVVVTALSEEGLRNEGHISREAAV